MRGEAHEVDVEGVEVDVDLAGALCAVHMKQDFFAAAQVADGGDVLYDADFVVDVHDGDEGGVCTQRGFKFVDINEAIGFGVEIGDFIAFAFQLPAAVEYRFVFGFAGDDVFTTLGVKMRGTFDGEVVGFGGAAGPDDFFGITVKQIGDVFARLFNRGFGFPAIGMGTRGGITELAFHCQVGAHLFGHARVYRGGGRIVEIKGPGIHIHAALL